MTTVSPINDALIALAWQLADELYLSPDQFTVEWFSALSTDLNPPPMRMGVKLSHKDSGISVRVNGFRTKGKNFLVAMCSVLEQVDRQNCP